MEKLTFLRSWPGRYARCICTAKSCAIQLSNSFYVSHPSESKSFEIFYFMFRFNNSSANATASVTNSSLPYHIMEMCQIFGIHSKKKKHRKDMGIKRLWFYSTQSILQLKYYKRVEEENNGKINMHTIYILYMYSRRHFAQNSPSRK